MKKYSVFSKISFVLFIAAFLFSIASCSNDTYRTAVEGIDKKSSSSSSSSSSKPEIVFIDDVSKNISFRDVISIEVRNFPNAYEYMYRLYVIDSQKECNEKTVRETISNNFIAGISYQSKKPLYWIDEKDNGKYLCAMAENTKGEFLFSKSAYPLNIDATPPTAIISNAPTGVSNTTVLNITVAGTTITNPDLVKYKYQVIEGTGVCDTAWSHYSNIKTVGTKITQDISSLSDGKIGLCVFGQDTTGLWEQPSNSTYVEWTKDTTVPTIAIDGISTSWVQSDDVTITVNDTHANATDHSSYQYAFIDAGVACDSDVNFSISFTSASSFTIATETHNGKYICAKAEDIAGNIAYKKSTNALSIDVTDPIIVFTDDINSALNNGDTIQIKASDTNLKTATGSLQYVFTGSTTCNNSTNFSSAIAYPNNTPFTIDTAAHNGEYICAKAEDNAGNIAYKRSISTFNIDVSDPIIVFTDDVNSTLNNGDAIQIQASDTNLKTATGSLQYVFINSTTCNNSTDFSSAIAYPNNTPFTIDTEAHNGEYICAKAEDNAGNIAYKKSTNALNIDVSDPIIVFTDDVNSTPNNGDAIQIKASDPNLKTATGSLQYVFINSTTCNASTDFSSAIAYTNNTPFTIDTEAHNGEYICAKAEDNTGNTGYKKSAYALNIDITPPTITSAETMDKDHDGKIDGYKITFTEAVDDSTFTVAKWHVSSHSGIALDTSVANDVEDDETIYISFAQNTDTCSVDDQNGCDTGTKPGLTMNLDGLKDIYGNSITVPTPTPADHAVPVVVGAEAPSNLSVRLVFSENVTASTAECGNGSHQSGVDCSTLYTITSGLAVSKAIIEGGSTSGNKVMLTTTGQTEGKKYTLTATVGTVKDVNGNAIISVSNTANFTGAAPALVLVSAEAVNNTTVKIVFNEALKDIDVANSATRKRKNYLIGGLTVMGVVKGSDDKTLLLQTTSQTSDTPNGYTVTVLSGEVSAQNTQSGECDAPNNTATFTGDKLPYVVSVSSINETTVFVRFSEDVVFNGTATNSALNVANYEISINSLTVSNPTSQRANTIVKLTTGDQTINDTYRLTVDNVQDLNGNAIHPTLNYGNFTGIEKLKLLMARNAWGSSENFGIFRLSFSKPFKYSGDGTGVHAADNLKNYSFPFPGNSTVSLCTKTDDNVCPKSYVEGTDTDIYFKVAPKPDSGAYTIVAATGVGSPAGAEGCLLPAVATTGTNNCLKPNPDDRAAISWWMPVNVDEGSAYDDPFNDNTTFSGQVVLYNGKLLIGPNDTDSGLFMTDINLQNSTNIVLDSDDNTTGIQTFKDNPSGDRVYDHGTVPLAGIDYMYAACDKGDSTLSGTDCTDVGGTERLYVVGYITETGGYQSVWITEDKVSPFSFKHVTGLSNHGERTFRAMSVRLFKKKVYQAQQHQKGSYPPRASRYSPAGTLDTFSGSGNDLAWRFIDRLGDMAAKRNGQWDAYSYPSNPSNKKTQLVSIDYMYEYNNDSSGTNESQLYMANGGSCVTSDLTNHSRTFTNVDGGIVRSTSTFSTVANPPRSCKSGNDTASRTYCKTMWADVTPGSDLASGTSANSGTAAYIWNHYMSKALPQDPTHDDTTSNDWDNLLPENTIAPSIKAIAKMVEFNGDLYAIRNACADVHVETLNSTVHDTCPAGEERPQLWRLPKDCGTAIQCAVAWQFIGDTSASATAAIKYTTRMGGAEWKDGINQDTKTAKNKYITLLETVGDKLYVGFDNENGVNIWRTKSTVTASNPPTSEADFEAACQTGNECAQPYKQFGLRGNIADIDVKIFDSVAVNDAGKDYLIMNARSGDKPLRIYRQGNY